MSRLKQHEEEAIKLDRKESELLKEAHQEVDSQELDESIKGGHTVHKALTANNTVEATVKHKEQEKPSHSYPSESNPN